MDIVQTSTTIDIFAICTAAGFLLNLITPGKVKTKIIVAFVFILIAAIGALLLGLNLKIFNYSVAWNPQSTKEFFSLIGTYAKETFVNIGTFFKDYFSDVKSSLSEISLDPRVNFANDKARLEARYGDKGGTYLWISTAVMLVAYTTYFVWILIRVKRRGERKSKKMSKYKKKFEA